MEAILKLLTPRPPARHRKYPLSLQVTRAQADLPIPTRLRTETETTQIRTHAIGTSQAPRCRTTKDTFGTQKIGPETTLGTDKDSIQKTFRSENTRSETFGTDTFSTKEADRSETHKGKVGSRDKA